VFAGALDDDDIAALGQATEDAPLHLRQDAE